MCSHKSDIYFMNPSHHKYEEKKKAWEEVIKKANEEKEKRGAAKPSLQMNLINELGNYIPINL